MNLGKSTKWTVLLLLLVAAANVSNAWADHRHGGNVHYGVGVVVAPRWDPWFWGPPYPYYPAYPPVVIEQSPPVYIEQPQPAPAPAPQQPAYWYYCPEANNYYPYVPTCPTGWQRIQPQPGDLR